MELFIQGEGKGELPCVRSKTHHSHYHSMLQNNEGPAIPDDINKTTLAASLQNKMFSPGRELIVAEITKKHSRFCTRVIYTSY